MNTFWWVLTSLFVGYGVGIRVALHHIRKAAKQAQAE